VDGIDAGWLALSSLMHQIIRGYLDRLIPIESCDRSMCDLSIASGWGNCAQICVLFFAAVEIGGNA
jgi:hypothetical protein